MERYRYYTTSDDFKKVFPYGDLVLVKLSVENRKFSKILETIEIRQYEEEVVRDIFEVIKSNVEEFAPGDFIIADKKQIVIFDTFFLDTMDYFMFGFIRKENIVVKLKPTK